MVERYYTYIVSCADGSFYCGYSTHPEARVAMHNAGKGAKYTRARRPVKLVYTEEFQTKQEAMSREWHLKRLSHQEKAELAQLNHQKKEKRL